MRNVGTRAVLTTAAAVFSAAVMVTPPTIAGAQQARTIIDADTTLQVRTNDAIDVKTADGLIYKGTIDQDVLDRDGLVAIGAAVGAAGGAGAQIITKGRSVYLPAESLVTFRLARRLNVGVADTGFDRENRHYHRDYGR